MRVVSDLYDVPLAPGRWDEGARTVFQTWDWQTAWWQVFGRGRLAVAVDESAGFAMPLFCDHDVLYPVGAGNSDYLDVVDGAGASAAEIAELLRVGLDQALSETGATSLCWYLLREDSPTLKALEVAARRLKLSVRVREDSALPAPAVDLGVEGVVERSSLRRRTRWLARNGELRVDRPAGGALVDALPGFFAQHVARWAEEDVQSPFTGQAEREFYVALAERAPAWLRMTRLWWDGAVVAQHVGMSFGGRYLWYKPTFDVALRQRSPGTALLHQLLRDAYQEGCTIFDFGIGEEAFKDRYADHSVRTMTVKVGP